MSIVAVIGAGALGGTITYRLAARDRVREIRLIDDALGVATATALDIQQSAAVQPFSTRVTAHRDLHAVVGADVLVLAGPVHSHVQPEGDHTAWTVDDGLRVIQQLATLNTRGVTVCAGGDHRRLVERGVNTSCFPRHRLIGSAPYAFQLALRAIVAVELNCSAMDVSLSVLGTPPEQVVVPWSEAAVQGTLLIHLLDPSQLSRLQQKIPRLWPLGPYVLAAAAARLCEAILCGTGSNGLPCSVALDGELGVNDRAAAMTVELDRSGVTHVAKPSVSVQERVLLESALARLD